MSDAITDFNDAFVANGPEPVRAAIESAAEAGGYLPLLIPVPIGHLLSANLDPPNYAIRSLVPRGLVTLLGGHGGAGKSMLALTLSAHAAAGVDWAGCEIEQCRAIYVSLEDAGPLVRFRLRKVVETYELDANAVAANLVVLDGTGGDAALVGEQNQCGVKHLLPTTAMEELRELTQGAGLIVIDNASDAFDADENHRRSVRAFMRMLAGIARDNDAGLILLAHIDKHAARNGSNGNTYSGSTAWHNSARSRLALVDEEGAIELRQEKLNLGCPMSPLRLHWTEHGVLMPLTLPSGSARCLDDVEAVMAALRAAHNEGVDVSPSRTGPSTAQKALETFECLPSHLRGPRGRGAFWAAIGKLLSSGRVEVCEIRTASRHSKKVLVEAELAEPAQRGSARANPPHPYALNSAHEGARVCSGLREFEGPEPAQTCASGWAEDA